MRIARLDFNYDSASRLLLLFFFPLTLWSSRLLKIFFVSSPQFTCHLYDRLNSQSPNHISPYYWNELTFKIPRNNGHFCFIFIWLLINILSGFCLESSIYKHLSRLTLHLHKNEMKNNACFLSFSWRIVYFISRHTYAPNGFIEFPDYTRTVTKLNVIHSVVFVFFFFVILSVQKSYYAWLPCVTQLNLITFVGLAEWIAETNNYHFNTEKNTWKIQLNDRQKSD